MADLLSPRELLPNFLWMDSRIHPGNEKVIEHVGALGDEAGMISRHRFDQAFDEFFAELLNHLGSAPRKESRGMARTGICAPACLVFSARFAGFHSYPFVAG